MTLFYKNTLCSFLFLISVVSLNAQTIRYVKQGGAGSGNGSSWANASADIQAMLNASTALDQVWVAGGTYKPNRRAYDLTAIIANDRDNAFVLYGTKLYGGFAGTETTLVQRNLKLAANTSILSGDFLNDDAVTGSGSTLTFTNNTENAYHVVINAFDGNTIDGFTIKGGNASTTGNISVNGNVITKNYGGGIHSAGLNFTAENLILKENSANFGAGIFNLRTGFNLNRVNINTNRAINQGSALYLGLNTITENTLHSLLNCSITNNRAAMGTITAITSSSNSINLFMRHCTVADNTPAGGGIIRSSGYSSIQIYNSILATATPSTGIVSLGGNTAMVYNSLIPDGLSNISSDSSTLIGLSPQFKNAAGGDYSLLSTSPAINAANNGAYGGYRDAAQNRRISGAYPDMGAYEYQAPKATPSAQGIVFVKKGSTGNGSSWASPLGELATALDAAQELNTATPGTITQIWVAGGTYNPLLRADNLAWENATDRDNAFVMVPDVKIYGNFAGTEATLAERNVKLTNNASVLSGDFSGDDIMTGSGSTLTIYNNTENAYHVVVASSGVGSAVLDGFTVRGGNADSNNIITVNGYSIVQSMGAGILINRSSLTLNNSTITRNFATNGAAIGNNLASCVATN